MSEWRDIETAPADYPDADPVKILVWIANGGLGRRGAADFGWVYLRKRSGERAVRAASYIGPEWHITHWMPLPEPPKDGA